MKTAGGGGGLETAWGLLYLKDALFVVDVRSLHSMMVGTLGLTIEETVVSRT